MEENASDGGCVITRGVMSESLTFWCMSVSPRAVGLLRSSLSSGSATSPEWIRPETRVWLSSLMWFKTPLISWFPHTLLACKGDILISLIQPKRRYLMLEIPNAVRERSCFCGDLKNGTKALDEKAIGYAQMGAASWERVQHLVFAHYPQSYRSQRYLVRKEPTCQ